MTGLSEIITLGQQVALLLECLPDASGQPYPLAVIAAAVGVSDQTLLNLLNGQSDNPRLETLLGLCQFYDLSLDYFDCRTEADCRAYLARQKIETGSPLVQEIAARSDSLSNLGKQNVLTLLGWAELEAVAHSGQRQREDQRHRPDPDGQP